MHYQLGTKSTATKSELTIVPMVIRMMYNGAQCGQIICYGICESWLWLCFCCFSLIENQHWGLLFLLLHFTFGAIRLLIIIDKTMHTRLSFSLNMNLC